MYLSIIDVFDVCIDNVNQTIENIKTFLTDSYSVFNSINDMLPNEMRSILIIAIALIQLLIIYNFIWGRK